MTWEPLTVAPYRDAKERDNATVAAASAAADANVVAILIYSFLLLFVYECVYVCVSIVHLMRDEGILKFVNSLQNKRNVQKKNVEVKSFFLAQGVL